MTDIVLITCPVCGEEIELNKDNMSEGARIEVCTYCYSLILCTYVEGKWETEYYGDGD